MHGEKVHRILTDSDFYADMLDGDGLTLPKVVKQAQLAQYNYILVIGDREIENNSVNVRSRDGEILGEMSLGENNDLVSFLDKKRQY